MKFKLLFFIVIVFFILSGCQKQPDSILIEVEADNSINNISNISSENIEIDDLKDEVVIVEDEKKEVKENSDIKEIVEEKKVEIIEIPTTLELKVAFAQQAPFGNWNEVTQETCEEASMIMVAKYFNNEPLNDAIMEKELEKHLAWQEERGYKVDLTAEETVFILREYFGLKAELSYQVEVNKIKAELFKGNLIIIPAAGRLLKNPNFKQPGPIYHMLVIKGYNHKEFITNDPGTRNGNGFKYPYDRLINAVHDWDHELAQEGMTDDKIIKGQKVMIIVSK